MEVVAHQQGCFYTRSGGQWPQQRLADAGLSLHWYTGCDRCAKPCPGCLTDAPPGTWVTDDWRLILRLKGTFVTALPVQKPVDPSRAMDADIYVPVPEGRILRPYQKAAVKFALVRKSVLIADEMGVGKSVEAVAIVNSGEGNRRILVVCPATLKANWAREIQAWDAKQGEILICDHVKDLPATWSEDRTWCICNPDKLVAARTKKDPDVVERAGGLWSGLMGVTWDVIILDEAHRFKNPKAARTGRVLGIRKSRKGPAQAGLAQRCQKLIALTGTPIPNRVRELWPLLSVIAPSSFPKESDFLFRYCGPKQQEVFKRGQKYAFNDQSGRVEGDKVWSFDGASNLEELQQRLRATCMIRRLKTDVVKELPAKTRQIIPLPGEPMKRQADAERHAWMQLFPKLTDVETDALIAEALGDTFAYEAALERLSVEIDKIDAAKIAAERQALALAKIPLVIDHVSDALENPDQKVVVMAHHREVISRLLTEFTKAGVQAVALSGATPMPDRQKTVDAFQNAKEIRVFIGGLHAAGVGLTLTAASLMVFVEADWQPGVLAQCEDRIHRIGQLLPVLIQYLVVDGSVEALIIAAALRKQRIADQALDGAPLQTRRKQYPKASEQDQALCKEALAYWSVADKLSQLRLRENTIVLIKSLAERNVKRPLTDGETWLCKKLMRENRMTLPTRLRSNVG